MAKYYVTNARQDYAGHMKYKPVARAKQYAGRRLVFLRKALGDDPRFHMCEAELAGCASFATIDCAFEKLLTALFAVHGKQRVYEVLQDFDVMKDLDWLP